MSDTQSKTMVTYPIIMALINAEQFLGAQRTWQPMDDLQARFLSEIFEPCRAEGPKLPEIESVASQNAHEINAFLRVRGFNMHLDPFPADTFGSASVLKLLVEWFEAGEQVDIFPRSRDRHIHRHYPGVKLTTGVTFFHSDIHEYPIAAIATQSEDIIYMTMMDTAPSGLDLVTTAEELTRSAYAIDSLEHLYFPMVDLDQRVDVSWLNYLATQNAHGQEWFLSQTLQHTILQMDEKGARVSSAFTQAAVMGWEDKESKLDMYINEPFMIWFVRPGLNKPLFVGHITHEDWKKPTDVG